MKRRFVSLLLACVMTCSLLCGVVSATGSSQDNLTDEQIESVLENAQNGTEGSVAFPEFSDLKIPENGISLVDVNHSNAPFNTRSANSITQQFTGYLTDQTQYLYVPVTLYEQQIVHATLVCPVNRSLDYKLLIGTVEGEIITPFKASNTATYIDPNTGKTLDESLSYIHNQAAAGNYAIIVMSDSGSSSTEEFTLTISIDASGSYDTNEPNDSPADATLLSWPESSSTQLTTTASINVVNDQDWYAVHTPDFGVFKLTAGDYKVDVFQYDENTNQMSLATKSPSGNFVLYNDHLYFIKVYTESTQDDFIEGDYTLSIVDQRKYTSMRNACDYGYWLYHTHSDSIPWGQIEAYYKFTVRNGEGVYAKVYLPNDGTDVFLLALSSNGTQLDISSNTMDGKVISSNGSSGFIAVNVDAADVPDNTVYLRVVYGNGNSNHPNPTVSKRLYKGYGTFNFTGTCTNSGNSVSNTISLNLTNSSKIPPRAIVSGISTTGSLSPGVGGVYHMVQPGNMGWAMSGTASAGTGTYPEIDESYGIEARQIWQFRYVQDAYASTKMTKISIKLDWIQDIQFTNYVYQA